MLPTAEIQGRGLNWPVVLAKCSPGNGTGRGRWLQPGSLRIHQGQHPTGGASRYPNFTASQVFGI